MALSGTIYGSFTGRSTSQARPYITWTATQNVANNTTTITATLIFVRYDGYNSFNNTARTFTITIDGTNYTGSSTFDIGPNGRTTTIMTASRTITHGDDGRKSITVSASGATGLSTLGNVTLSQSITFDTIPRASGFTAFSLNSTSMVVSTARTISYTLDRKSTSFSHDMTLKLGSKTIKSWSTSGTGALTISLTAAEVNNIISSLPNATSGTLTLTMQTKSGSSNIGSPVSRNVTISIAALPTASGMSVSIPGSGRDKTINRFVQTISKVTASFTRAAGYGASISSSSIVVRRVSGGSNSQSIGSHSGTTANAVTLSGTYEAIGTVVDSRGRSATSRVTFNVEAYSSPKINTFSARRNRTTSTTVVATLNLSYSPLGTLNPASIVLVGVNKAGTRTTHRNNTGQTAGTLNTSQNITGQVDTSSYTYILTVTDSFGKKAEATETIGTSFIEFSIARGKGIGVGKVHEDGSLDVHGPIFISSPGSTGKLAIDSSPNDALDELQISARFNGLRMTHMWFREDAAGFWDAREPGGVWRYDLEDKLFDVQATGGLRARNLASGIVVTGVHVANQTKSIVVSFGKTFRVAPRVVVAPHTGVPERVSFGVGAITTTGFTLHSNRTDTATTSYSWIAFYDG